MEVKIKKLHKDAVIPSYSKIGDNGLDLTAISNTWDKDNYVFEYSFGLAIEIPMGFVGIIVPRSSIYKYDMMLTNHCGVIDSSYRGEIKAKFKETVEDSSYIYKIGDRIAQLLILPCPKITFIETDELNKSERGQSGFGSSGT